MASPSCSYCYPGCPIHGMNTPPKSKRTSSMDLKNPPRTGLLLTLLKRNEANTQAFVRQWAKHAPGPAGNQHIVAVLMAPKVYRVVAVFESSELAEMFLKSYLESLKESV